MHDEVTTTVESGNRGAALEALGGDQVRRLAAYANLCSNGLPEDGQDLLQAAYQRWLSSEVPIADAAATTNYLFGAIKSIRSNEFRRKRSELAALGERIEPYPHDEEAEPSVELVPASSAAPDETIYVQQVYDALDDSELRLLVLHQAEGTARKLIQMELGWDDKKYEAVQKRKLRALAKLLNEGKI